MPTTSVFVTHDQVEAMTLGDRIVVMKDGLMQQVGSPLELYRRPLNRFVASFIGSPAMNFIDMAVTAAADSFALSANGIAIELPQRRFAGLGAHAGRTVTMGVRPQHMRLGPANGGEHDAAGQDRGQQDAVEDVLAREPDRAPADQLLQLWMKLRCLDRWRCWAAHLGHRLGVDIARCAAARCAQRDVEHGSSRSSAQSIWQ